jgi:hypothetical protein
VRDVAGQASIRPTDEGAPRAHVHPDRDPFAPGNVPNRLSKVLFSLTTNTTCLIGVRVVNAFAFTNRGVRGTTVGVAEIAR